MTDQDKWTASQLKVGERLRFSVALLKQIYEMPDHSSGLVTLKEIRVEKDGAKLLVLERFEMKDVT